MLIFPAIDLRGGQVVRLTEGNYDRMTVYGTDPSATAKAFREAGAAYLHVVDLDGAKDGGQANFQAIQGILAASGLSTQVGGGARDAESVARYLDAGIDRVILGTMLVENPVLADHLAARYPGRIAAGVDAREGKVAIHGWRTVTDLDAAALIRTLPDRGIDTVIYTDIARDGRLSGPNLPAYAALNQIPGLRVVASGGVSAEQDILSLREMGVYAAIIGKALYTGRVKLEAAIALAAGKERA